VDVIAGSATGASISLVEFYLIPTFDEYMHNSSSWMAPLTVAMAIIALVRLHPEPADDCPCFDDSVAFAGVAIGLEMGTWHFGRGPVSAAYADPAFALSALGWPTVLARIAFGVLVIFAWREVMKPTLLKGLPHLFRVIETHGLSLPRRFFMPASEYEDVPLSIKDDNVLPSVSDLPILVRSIGGPGRGRSISIGPQSAADAYETLAYRERRRRESAESERSVRLRAQGGVAGLGGNAGEDATAVEDREGTCGAASGVQHQQGPPAEYEAMMGQATLAVSPSPRCLADENAGEGDVCVGQQDELGEKEMFEKLVKPRVRYDVEVVTKLVVYTGESRHSPLLSHLSSEKKYLGIAWLAVDFIPEMFELVGLGVKHLQLQ
jgi:hypothetical protein